MSNSIRELTKENLISELENNTENGVNIIWGKCNEEIKEEDFNNELLLEIDDILVDSNSRYYLDATQKIVATIFKSYKEELDNNREYGSSLYAEKKMLVAKFEKVMKCLRYEILGIENFLKKIDDDLELLNEMSEVISIKEAVEELVVEYLKIYKKKSMVIYIKHIEDSKEIVLKEVIRIFNIKGITMILPYTENLEADANN